MKDNSFTPLTSANIILPIRVPMFIGAGRSDHVTDSGLAYQYFERIVAPRKNQARGFLARKLRQR
jgi:hypothetical protein